MRPERFELPTYSSGGGCHNTYVQRGIKHLMRVLWVLKWHYRRFLHTFCTHNSFQKSKLCSRVNFTHRVRNAPRFGISLRDAVMMACSIALPDPCSLLALSCLSGAFCGRRSRLKREARRGFRCWCWKKRSGLISTREESSSGNSTRSMKKIIYHGVIEHARRKENSRRR